MSEQLPIQIQLGALPPNVSWTPQQLGDALVQRMRLVSSQSFSLFVAGSTEPSSNVGPWLRNGTEWYVWSDTSGSYVPISVPVQSLGYIVGDTAPDPNETNFWIQTTAPGSPLALKIYYSGAWVDVYATTLGAYLTIAAFNAAIANYSTTAQMNAAIVAAIAGIPPPTSFASYPAQGGSPGAQSVPIDGPATFTKVTLDSAIINPAPAPFDTGQSRYVAPASGIYAVSFSCQLDNNGGAASAMSIGAALYKNGSAAGAALADIDNTPSPNGSRWSPGFSGLISLNANDYLEVFINPDDGVNAGDITVTAAQLSVHRVSA